MFSEETKRALLEEAAFHHRRHRRRGRGSRLSRHFPKQRVGMPGRRRLGGGGADVEEESRKQSRRHDADAGVLRQSLVLAPNMRRVQGSRFEPRDTPASCLDVPPACFCPPSAPHLGLIYPAHLCLFVSFVLLSLLLSARLRVSHWTSPDKDPNSNGTSRPQRGRPHPFAERIFCLIGITGG